MVLLVLLHRRCKQLVREIQKPVFDGTDHGNGPFRQSGIFVQQFWVFDKIEPVFFSKPFRLLANSFLPIPGIENDEGLLKLRLVIVERFYLELRWRHKPVASRRIACPNAIDLEIHCPAAGFIVQYAQDRVKRAHPPQLSGAPNHRLWPNEFLNGISDGFSHNLRKWLSRDR